MAVWNGASTFLAIASMAGLAYLPSPTCCLATHQHWHAIAGYIFGEGGVICVGHHPRRLSCSDRSVA